MSDSQNKSYILYIDNTEAEKSLKKLRTTAADLEKEIADITAKGGNATKQMVKLGKTQDEIKNLENSIKGGLNKSVRDMVSEVRKLENALNRMPVTARKEIAQLQAQLAAAKANLEQYRGTVNRVGAANKQMSSETRGFFGSMKDFVVGTFLGGGLVGMVQSALTSVVSFFQDAHDAAMEADKAVRMFENTMNNLGKGADAGRYADFASRIKDELDFLDDEEILGVFRQLQTYGKLTEQQIRELTPVIIDFAVQQEQSLSESADVIIKALDGSAKGLKTYGLNLKDAGTVSERFSVIMSEMKNKVDGAARAFQDSEAGPMALYKQGAADIAEEVGENLSPSFVALTKTKTELLKFFNDVHEAVASGEYIFERQTAAAIELQNTLSRFNMNNSFTQSVIQDFAGLPIEEQEKRVAQNKALYESSKQLVEQLEREKAAFGDRYLKAQAQMIQDKDLYLETNLILIENKRERAEREAAEKREEQEKKSEKAREKQVHDAERRAERLKEFLKKTTQETTGFNLSEYEREIKGVHDKYAEFEKMARKGSAEEIQLTKNKAAEIDQINKKQAAEAQKGYEEAQKKRALLLKEEADKAQKENERILQGSRDSLRAFSTQLEKSLGSIDTAKLINADLKARKAGLFTRLSAEKAYLAEARRQEENSLRARYDAAEITQEEYLARRADIEDRFRQSSYQAEIAYYQSIIGLVSELMGHVLSAYDTISQSLRAKEENELARDKALNEEKRKNLKAQLDGKLISRDQFDNQVTALDEKQDQREKVIRRRQFEREKIANIGQALMGTAQAVIQALDLPWPLNLVIAGLMGAMGAVQLGIITSQKAPEFGRGGRPKGPSHDSPTNGMPVINPTNNRVEAYLEGGEGILLKKAMDSGDTHTITGTPSAIASKLNSMYGGVSWDASATLAPAFARYQPMSIDFPDVAQRVGNVVRMYATGGMFQAPASTEQPRQPVVATDPELKSMVMQVSNAVSALTTVLSAGIYAKTYLNEQDAAQQRQTNIRDNTTFRA